MATAFAVFCADDGSLNFYKRDTVPTAGSTFEGKAATVVYEGIETSKYTSYSNVPWYSDGNYANITNITFVNTISPISTQYWFYKCSTLTTILNLNKLNTSNVTNMSSMFNRCSAITSLDLSGFDTSNVTDMRSIFYQCKALTSLDLSSFDTSNLNNLDHMFSQCKALTALNLSNFNTSNVSSMDSTFDNCTGLTSLDLSSFDTSNVIYMGSLFYNCTKLTTIYVSECWSTEKVTTSDIMFSNCTLLVGDIAYNSSYADKTYATYTGGYLTYRPTIYHQDFLIKGGTLYDTAEAIREKTGSEDIIKAKDFPAAIAAIPSASGLSVVGTYFTGDINSSSSKYHWGIYDWYSSIAGNCIDLSKCELGKTYMHLEFKNGSYYDYNLHCMYPDGSNTTYLANMKLYDKNGNEGAGSSNFLQYGIMYYKFRVEKGTITNGYDVYDADTGSKICTNAIRLYGAVGHSMAFLLD